MNRRDFIKNSCGMACACIGISAVSLFQSCEDNKAYERNTNDGVITPDSDNQIVLNILDPQYQSLTNISGSAVTSSNSIDSLGLLLIRSSESQIKAFSRRCTHSSYKVNAFNSQGLAVCSSGHGGSFNTNGRVAAGPPTANLTSYDTTLESDTLTIFG
tara:strand:- start:57 stop:530 length:474 start_codon:yes stop_codon:yes gene_type:complete